MRPLLNRCLAALVLLSFLFGFQVALAAGYLQQARDHLDQGEHRAAIIQLKNHLVEQPDSTEARVLLGEAYLAVGDLLSAEKELTRSRGLGASEHRTMAPLAQAYLGLGNISQSLETLRPELLQDRSLRSRAYSLRGMAYLALQQIDKAKDAFNQGLKAERSEDALLGLARIALLRRQFDEGLVFTQEVLESDSSHTGANLLQGSLYLPQGETDKAIESFTRGVKGHSNNIDLRVIRAEAYMEQGRLQEALQDLTFVLKLDPEHSGAHYHLSRVQLEEGDFAGARASAEETLRRFPDHLPSFYILGAALHGLQQFNQAEIYLENFLKRVPRQVDAERLLASIYIRQNKPAKAVARLEVLFGQVQVDDAELYALLGSAYAMQGDYAKSLDLLKRAVNLAPDVPHLRTQLAMATLFAGDRDGAIGQLEGMVTGERSDKLPSLLLILSYLNQRQLDKARQLIESGAVKEPDNALYPLLRGLTYKQEGDWAAADHAFQRALAIAPDFPPALVELGNRAVDQGQLDQAKTHYAKVLEQVPAHGRALPALVQLEERQGHQDLALKRLLEARKAAPGLEQPARMMVEFYLRNGQPLEAVSEARQHQIRHPDRASALALLADALAASDQPGQAEATLRQLIKLQPKEPLHRFKLAGLLTRSGELTKSLAVLGECLEIEPGYQDAWVAKINIELQQQQFTEAQGSLDAFRRQSPNATITVQLGGDLLASQGLWPQAILIYTRAYAKQASSLLAAKLSSAHIKNGDLSTATATLEAHLDVYPRDLSNRIHLAMLLQTQQQHLKAIGHYLKVIALQPENIEVLNNLAWLYQQAGSSEARRHGEQAYQLAPKNPAVNDTLGWIYVQEGEARQGLELIRFANQSMPNDLLVRFHLAVALHQAGFKDEALGELQGLLSRERFKQFSEFEQAKNLYSQLQ